MEKLDFAGLENMCRLRFMKAGKSFHFYSREDYPIMFHNQEEFKAAMNAVAFAAFLFPEVVVLTFEIMDNHFHFVVRGDEDRVMIFLHTLLVKLAANPGLKESSGDIRKVSFKGSPLKTLDNLRNVIAYVNRNGFVVTQDHSPFSYPWGANRYFFNIEAKLRLKESGREASFRQKREMFHSDLLAKTTNVLVLDGYVSPASYCHIGEAESYFRNCRHYYQCVSRNIESAKDVAKSIGERIFYSDEDLYTIVGTLCSKKFHRESVKMLTSDEKIDLARILHFDYNAGNKQISRTLRIDFDVVSSLFPVRN